MTDDLGPWRWVEPDLTHLEPSTRDRVRAELECDALKLELERVKRLFVTLARQAERDRAGFQAMVEESNDQAGQIDRHEYALIGLWRDKHVTEGDVMWLLGIDRLEARLRHDLWARIVNPGAVRDMAHEFGPGAWRNEAVRRYALARDGLGKLELEP